MRYDDDRLNFLIKRVPGFWRQDKSSNNYKALSLIAKTYNDANDAVDEIYKLWHIDTSYGRGLDDIGVDIGLPRKNMSDRQYRKLLKIKRYLDMSDATIADLNIIFSAFMGDDFLFIQEGYTDIGEPASIALNISKNSSAIPYEVAYIAKAGGVRIYYSITFDKLLAVAYVDQYEYKTYYPITNISRVGYNIGRGDALVIDMTHVTYQHKVYSAVTNIHVCNAYHNNYNIYYNSGTPTFKTYFLTPLQPTKFKVEV